MSDESVAQVVYGPKDWRELNEHPVPTLPGGSVMCAAIKDDGVACGNRALAGTPFCRHHGGTTLAVQEAARRRVDAVRGELFVMLVDAAKDATDTYIEIMRNGKRAADRLRAADRILELIGFRDDIANVPGGGVESDIDRQLHQLLTTVAQERLARAIDVTSHSVEGDDGADGQA